MQADWVLAVLGVVGAPALSAAVNGALRWARDNAANRRHRSVPEVREHLVLAACDRNPLADEHGNVYAPNVNVVEEMTDMISASRAYQDNVEVLNTSKDLMLATLKLGS